MARQEAAHYLDLPGAADSTLEFAPTRWKRQELFGSALVVCKISGVDFDLDDASVTDLGLQLKNNDQRNLLDRERRPLPFTLMTEGAEVLCGHLHAAGAIRNEDRRIRLRFADTAFDFHTIRRQGAASRLSRALAAEDAIQPYIPAHYAEQCGRFVQRLQALGSILEQ